MRKSFKQKKITINVECFEDDGWVMWLFEVTTDTMRTTSKKGMSLTTGISGEESLAEDRLFCQGHF